jgi:hypothetical protein
MMACSDKISTINSHAAYMREYRKRKQLEGDNCNNVPKRTKLNAKKQHDYRKCKVSENKTPQAGNSRAAYMSAYRRMMWVEKDIRNNIPKQTKLNVK